MRFCNYTTYGISYGLSLFMLHCGFLLLCFRDKGAVLAGLSPIRTAPYELFALFFRGHVLGSHGLYSFFINLLKAGIEFFNIFAIEGLDFFVGSCSVVVHFVHEFYVAVHVIEEKFHALLVVTRGLVHAGAPEFVHYLEIVFHQLSVFV